MKNPSTNTPISCIFATCKEVHWKYNMAQHLHDQHPNWKEKVSPEAAATFEAKIAISTDEERALGIPDTFIRNDDPSVSTAPEVVERLLPLNASSMFSPMRHPGKRDKNPDGLTPSRAPALKLPVLRSSTSSSATSNDTLFFT